MSPVINSNFFPFIPSGLFHNVNISCTYQPRFFSQSNKLTIFLFSKRKVFEGYCQRSPEYRDRLLAGYILNKLILRIIKLGKVTD